jgi:hypothetical protein
MTASRSIDGCRRRRRCTQTATALPLGRRGSGCDALAGGLSEQVASIEHEAGVREQL